MDKELTFVDHLEELRRRIIISLIVVVAASAAAFPFAPTLLKILKVPSSGVIEKLVYFSPPEAFMIHIRIALSAGLALALPVILYQVWAFLSPAIEPGVKRHGLLFLLFSAGAFILGAAFGFFALLPAAFKFLITFSGDDLEPLISATSYISFALGLTLAAGIVFQMPVLAFLLTKIGIINYHSLRRIRKYAVIVIFIIAAIVTPTPDIFNMTILAIPMLLLYELGIWVSRFSGLKSTTATRCAADRGECDKR